MKGLQRFVQDYVFGVRGRHGTVKLRYETRPAAGGDAISVSVDFMLLADDGRIRAGYQFIEA